MSQSTVAKAIQNNINMKIAIIEGKLSDIQQEGATEMAKIVKEIETAFCQELTNDFTFEECPEGNDLIDHIFSQADYHDICDSDIMDAYDKL